MTRILVCNPDHYGVVYSINPWMKPEIPTDNSLALSQWLDLVKLIQKCGGEVFDMSGKPNLPDIVFTANAGTVFGNKIVLSNFSCEQRRPEKTFYRTHFQSLGLETIELPENQIYEGAGDALWSRGTATGDILWCGYGWRSSIEAHNSVKKIFGVETVLLRLVDPSFYHLDTCFCPLQDDQALIYPGAFDHASYNSLDWSFYFIEVPVNEARRFACNAICIDRQVIIPADCPITKGLLEQAGYTVFECPMTEFIKAGGACKCLSLAF